MYLRIIVSQNNEEVVYLTQDVIRRGFDGSLFFRIKENGEVYLVNIDVKDILLIQLFKVNESIKEEY